MVEIIEVVFTIVDNATTLMTLLYYCSLKYPLPIYLVSLYHEQIHNANGCQNFLDS